MVIKGNHRGIQTLFGQALHYHQVGNRKAAKASYVEVLKLDPDNAEALHLLGCVYDDIGNTGQAIKLLARAVKANPKAHAYFYNLANMLLRQGDYKEAIRHYREAIRLKPDYALAYNNLGRVLAQMGQRNEAKACFACAIQCKPGYADPHHNLGIELKGEGDLDGAVVAFLAAIEINPNFADAFCNLGSTYLLMQRVTEAAVAYRKAVDIQPGNSRHHTNVGGVMLKLGRHQDAIAAFNVALRLDPSDAFTRSALILATSYISSNAAELYALSAHWDHVHGVPLRGAINRHGNAPDPDRRLRVGYVSADFRNHAAVFWIEPLLAVLHHGDFEVVCYNNNARVDFVTERIKPLADAWIECATLSDEALAERIRRDGIDILVDLSSHTEGHRLLVFARQPAPVQVSWFGFPVSTGLKTMQYRLTDAVMDPPNQRENFYSEKLIRLNRFYAAFRPDPATPGVGDSPFVQNGFVTFASFNTFAKITPSMLDLWATILVGTPHSRLLLQAAGVESLELTEMVRSAFTVRGVEPHRLTLRGWTSIEDYLRLGQEADIALDPYPFNGGVTTCHALWMGLPVITLSGQSAASRVGASILGRMGLAECVANDPDTYRDNAVRLAQDGSKLSALRASLRTRMETAGLLDGAGLASEVDGAFRAMWRTWCAGTQT